MAPRKPKFAKPTEASKAVPGRSSRRRKPVVGECGQLPLVPAQAETWPRKVWVSRDYGQLPGKPTATRPRQMDGLDGKSYLAKGAGYAPQRPCVVPNELVSARLAGLLGLPVRDCCILVLAGTQLFGSLWIERTAFYNELTADLLDRCENREQIYGIVAFDAWLCNRDRHHRNFMVTIERDEAKAEHLNVVIIDHSECPVRPLPETAADLSALLGTSPRGSIRLAFVRDAIEDPSLLDAAIARIERLDPGIIRETVRAVPAALWPKDAQGLVEDFLIARQAELRAAFAACAHEFPRLRGGLP